MNNEINREVFPYLGSAFPKGREIFFRPESWYQSGLNPEDKGLNPEFNGPSP